METETEADETLFENSPLADEEDESCRDIRIEKRRIYKNVLTICFTFLLTFMAFVPLQNLQSSLNGSDGIGLASLTVIYTFLILSSLFFTPLIINSFGCKWTMFIGTFGYVIFTAANFYPTWFTMIPASVVVGFAAGPMWAAKCSYLTSSAIAYAKIVKKPAANFITWFFGIFFAFFMTGQILGYITSSLVLESPIRSESMINETNPLNTSTSFRPLICGAEDCPAKSIDQYAETKEPSRESVYILLSILLCAVFAAVIPLGVFVDQIEVTGSEEKAKNVKFKMLEPLRQLKDVRMMLFCPLIVAQGIFIGFIGADFTKSYVVCPIGIESVGLVLISYALVKGIFALISGFIVKYIGRKILLSSSCVLILIIVVILRIWKPDNSNQAMIYSIAGMAGLCMAIQDTQINAFLGTVFWNKQEASFANLRIFQSLGFVISFAYGSYLCVYVKLYILMTTFTVSLVLYIAAEVLVSRISKKTDEANNELAAELKDLQS